MSLQPKVWRVLAVLFSVGKLAAAIFAAAQEEQLHTDIHVALLLVGAYFVWRLSPKRINTY
jgi:hypothetical protein